MNHHTEAERAEFEAWCESEGLDHLDRGFGEKNDYAFVETRRMWASWKAARRVPASPVPQIDPAFWRACDLLSMTVGTLMGFRVKIGYTDNSPIAGMVSDAVEFLRPWPEKLPTTAISAAPSAQPPEANCPRCEGSGEDPEGFYDQSRGPDGDTHEGPCRNCGGSGAAAPVQMPEKNCTKQWRRAMQSELKPCPMCAGSAGVLEDIDWPPDVAWSIFCTECDVSTGGYESEDAAIAAWNRRAPEGEEK